MMMVELKSGVNKAPCNVVEKAFVSLKSLFVKFGNGYVCMDVLQLKKRQIYSKGKKTSSPRNSDVRTHF